MGKEVLSSKFWVLSYRRAETQNPELNTQNFFSSLVRLFCGLGFFLSTWV